MLEKIVYKHTHWREPNNVLLNKTRQDDDVTEVGREVEIRRRRYRVLRVEEKFDAADEPLNCFMDDVRWTIVFLESE